MMTTHRRMFGATVGALLAAVGVSVSSTALATAQSLQPFKTVWQGVYTQAEAARGKQAAAQLCSRCHGVNLAGGAAPRLTGSPFFERWHDLKVLDTTAYIQSAMPHEHEVFVSAEATRDIVAFMLQESGVPPGREPMPKDVDALSNILITRPPGK